jgi:hypothetical protein
MRRRRWSIEQLKSAVNKSYSLRQVLVLLSLRPAGGNYEQLKHYISEAGLDTSHFRGKGWSAGLRGIGSPRIALKDILVKNSNFQSFKLKKRLFSEKIKLPSCEKCSWAEKTVAGYLPLELHHVNGDRHDNRIENLKILCPNCHSLTDSHRGRNRGKY